MQTISKQTCTLSQFYDWLICRNVRVTVSWLLLSLPAGGGSAVGWWPRPVLCCLCVNAGIRLQSPSASLPCNPLPYHGPWNRTHACVHARRAGKGAIELNALWLSCVMRSVNSWWTCSDARNIISGWYNSSQCDSNSIWYTQYDTPSIGSNTIPIR